MEKLSLDALKARANDVASEELMSQISGGIENACHDKPLYDPDILVHPPDGTIVK